MTETLPYWPAAMNLQTASRYCGLSPQTFREVCPVKPIRFTDSNRGERYLRQRIDEWLFQLDPNAGSNVSKRKFGDRLNGGQSAP